jgi:long-subunit acyl-CoA synthetase (AMP-forming)
MAGVPMLWSAIRNIILSRYGEITSTSVASLLGEYIAIMMSGGANTNIQLRQSFVDAGIYFVVGYGLTETGIISYMLPQRSDITSEGVCFDWYKCAVKTDDNKILEEGQGELLIKSDVLMDGFYMGGTFHEIELTDGYYNTEDIFKIHNGEIFFMGRSKNVIVNDSGENIYIEELEQYFSETFSSVGMFFGIIDRNDQPYLVVESSQGDIPKELFSLVHAKVKELPIYKQPKEMVVTSTALPRTTKGELKRNLVTEDFLEKNSNKTYNFKATIQ